MTIKTNKNTDTISPLASKCKVLEFECPQQSLNTKNLPVSYLTKNRQIIFDWYLDVYEFLYKGEDQKFMELMKKNNLDTFPKEYLNSTIYNALILLDFYISVDSFLNSKYYQLLASSTFLTAFLIEGNLQKHFNSSEELNTDKLYQFLLQVFVYLCENSFSSKQLHITVYSVKKKLDISNLRSFVTPFHYSSDLTNIFSTSIYLVANNVNLLHSYKSYEIFKTCNSIGKDYNNNNNTQNKLDDSKQKEATVNRFDGYTEDLKQKIEGLIHNYLQ
ncbi:hypothetical protein ABK040_003220 [Willaertia magna]